MTTIPLLAENLGLGALLSELKASFGEVEHIAHWTQGEFHHDIVLRVPNAKPTLPGSVLVVATNCNGGVKELLLFDRIPDRKALWHGRCPDTLSSAVTHLLSFRALRPSIGSIPVASCSRTREASCERNFGNVR